jgi:hypothetical protein
LLVVSLLCAVIVPTSASATTSRFVRTSLGDAPARTIEPSASRIIRSSLDEPGHAAFPLDDDTSRLIRVTLDDANDPYRRLGPAEVKTRYVRTSLD